MGLYYTKVDREYNDLSRYSIIATNWFDRNRGYYPSCNDVLDEDDIEGLMEAVQNALDDSIPLTNNFGGIEWDAENRGMTLEKLKTLFIDFRQELTEILENFDFTHWELIMTFDSFL